MPIYLVETSYEYDDKYDGYQINETVSREDQSYIGFEDLQDARKECMRQIEKIKDDVPDPDTATFTDLPEDIELGEWYEVANDYSDYWYVRIVEVR
jgi:hypothetical protein